MIDKGVPSTLRRGETGQYPILPFVLSYFSETRINYKGHLEYCVHARLPFLAGFRTCATKNKNWFMVWENVWRLQILGLTTLEPRRLRDNLNETYSRNWKRRHDYDQLLQSTPCNHDLRGDIMNWN